MATARSTYVNVRAVIDHPIAVVWAPIARFGGLDRWAAGITGCELEGKGVGAVRSVSVGDRNVRERLEAIDPEAHCLRYYIVPPHAMPAEDVHSEIILTAIGNDRTEIIWRSEAASFSVPPEQLGDRIGTFYSRSIDGLRRMLDGGQAD